MNAGGWLYTRNSISMLCTPLRSPSFLPCKPLLLASVKYDEKQDFILLSADVQLSFVMKFNVYTKSTVN
jgi:hypothetical protein